MSASSEHDLLRQIPGVDQILLQPRAAEWVSRTSRGFVVSEIQKLLNEVRTAIRTRTPGVATDRAWLDEALDARLHARLRPVLKPVINATGVILHTNLGRAPLSQSAQETLSAVSSHYTNLEFDLDTGARSKRDKLVEPVLRDILGCEAALVVNNNAAAVFLILNTLAYGREVIVSRGELIEIGGSFRIPDIMTRSGARLVEVGTTNKTRLEDYEGAIGSETALLLRVHPSNYRIRGFTERPALPGIVGLAQRSGVPLVEDLGSGCLVDLRPFGIPDEPVAQESIAAGVDLICFSADKLLGGPQAGIVAGARKWIELIRKNPLARALRVEKLVYGALEATLTSYSSGRATQEIPVLSMIAAAPSELEARARDFAGRLRTGAADAEISVIDGHSVIGGGSCPDAELRTSLVAITSARLSPNSIENGLRAQDPPVIVRLEADRVLVDLRTVFPSQESRLLDALIRVLG